MYYDEYYEEDRLATPADAMREYAANVGAEYDDFVGPHQRYEPPVTLSAEERDNGEIPF